MRFLLALVAALTLASQAHAACPTGTQLQGNAMSWFTNQTGGILECNTSFGPVGSNCAPNGGVTKTCHRIGQPDFWRVHIGTSCSNGGKLLISSVEWKPTTWQFFGTFRCGCAPGETNLTCYWL